MVTIFGVGVGSIFIASIAAYALGWAWHVGLGTFWMRFTQTSAAEAKKMEANNKPSGYVGEFIALLVTAFAFGAILGEMELTGAWAGAGLGVLAWMGFSAATTISMVLWGSQTWRAWIPANAYRLVSYVLIGAIMA